MLRNRLLHIFQLANLNWSIRFLILHGNLKIVFVNYFAGKLFALGNIKFNSIFFCHLAVKGHLAENVVFLRCVLEPGHRVVGISVLIKRRNGKYFFKIFAVLPVLGGFFFREFFCVNQIPNCNEKPSRLLRLVCDVCGVNSKIRHSYIVIVVRAGFNKGNRYSIFLVFFIYFTHC